MFSPPEPLLSQVPLLLGLDGRKMSKSRGNAIALSDPPDVVAGKIRAPCTDSERTISYDRSGARRWRNLLRLAALCADRCHRVFGCVTVEG